MSLKHDVEEDTDILWRNGANTGTAERETQVKNCVESKWCQFGINVVSVKGRCSVRLVSVLCQCCCLVSVNVSVVSVWCQWMSVWCLCDVSAVVWSQWVSVYRQCDVRDSPDGSCLQGCRHRQSLVHAAGEDCRHQTKLWPVCSLYDFLLALKAEYTLNWTKDLADSRKRKTQLC